MRPRLQRHDCFAVHTGSVDPPRQARGRHAGEWRQSPARVALRCVARCVALRLSVSSCTPLAYQVCIYVCLSGTLNAEHSAIGPKHVMRLLAIARLCGAARWCGAAALCVLWAIV
jgi:hypothetical protein